LAATSVRIEAPIPGKAAIGIEVPNKNVSSVNLRDVLDTSDFKNAQGRCCFAVGKDITGENIVADLSKMPHLLVAGTTGSGKSVCINSMIISLVYKYSPEEVRFIMVDPKVVELNVYNGLPHLLLPVVTEPKKASGVLKWAVNEMTDRYNVFAKMGVRDLGGYNNLAEQTGEPTSPQIVVIVDELADLMMTAPHDVEDAICRLAQMGRAAGIHLVLATQRPDANVITGLIKANIPSRIAFSVPNLINSRIILDMGGAEKLLGKGDMLYFPGGAPKPVRVQGCFISDAEVRKVVNSLKEEAEPDYKMEILEELEEEPEVVSGSDQDKDELFPDAVEIVLDSGQASISMIQRRLRVGYARAARLIDEMELMGIVSGFEGSKARRVLIEREDYERMFSGQGK
ncbi:MAG: DNA translocase FtsK, partial [Christensenellales bacterium]